jgi:hypothetical protein
MLLERVIVLGVVENASGVENKLLFRKEGHLRRRVG